MKRVLHWLGLWLVVGILAGRIAAAEKAPPAPANGVVDAAGFLNDDPEALARISETILTLRDERNFEIYLDVEQGLIAVTPAELASQYRGDWLPAGNGLVLVFETDGRILGIGREIGDGAGDGDAARVPGFEMTAILERVREEMGGKSPESPADLANFVEGLAAGVESYFSRREEPPPRERSLRMAMLIAGVMALVGLCAIALGGWFRHSRGGNAARFRFPASDVRERLGAPCGAAVTARKFARGPEK